MTTRASNEWPMAATSMESVMTSRLMSEARMPSVPMETPSLTEMVLTSIGVPPAARMPSLTRWAMRRWLKLQGMVSIHWCATPTMGRARSSSEKPMDLSWERAGARAGPSVMAALLRLRGSDMRSPRGVETVAVSGYMVGAEARGFKSCDARLRGSVAGRTTPPTHTGPGGQSWWKSSSSIWRGTRPEAVSTSRMSSCSACQRAWTSDLSR